MPNGSRHSHDYESPSSILRREILDRVIKLKLLTKDPALRSQLKFKGLCTRTYIYILYVHVCSVALVWVCNKLNNFTRL
jgi:hypothetical protein